MDRKERINELKRKNAITILCKRWNEQGIEISTSDFLNCVETVSIQRKIINKLDEMDKHNKSIVYTKADNIIPQFIEKLLYNINNEVDYVFFLKESTKYGAIIIKGQLLKDNVDFIIRESEYFNNSCCVLCYSNIIDSGICLWLGEYDNRIYIW